MEQAPGVYRGGARVTGAPRLPFDDESFPFRKYVEQRTIVLDSMRVLYMPLPKAACTSMLWLMAGLAGVPSDRFRTSERAYATLSMAVHDPDVWGSAGHFRLADFTGEERERVLTEDGWFRFTLVRDPAARLWSAWQSKILLRDPRYLRWFGDRYWFARMPDSPATVLEDFHSFLAALHADKHEGGLADEHEDVRAEDMRDVHWAEQHTLAGCLPFDHVGRVERLGDTLSKLRAHVGDHVPVPDSLPRENSTPLPGGAPCYAGGRAALVRELYRTDFDEYGYSPPDDGAASPSYEQWSRSAEERLTLIQALIARHERLAALHEITRTATKERDALTKSLDREKARARSLADRLETSRGRQRELKRLLAETREELRQARASKRAARQRAQAAVAEWNRLRGSTSWKLTRPLRVAGALVRRRH